MVISSLRNLLNHHFDNNEMRLLCLELSIEYENLIGDTRIARAQSLVEHCLRHDRFPDLLTRCQELRPAVAWPNADELAAEWQKVQQDQADPIGNYLAQMAQVLSANVLANIPIWVQVAWQGTETDAAVRRCLDAGIAAFIRCAGAEVPLDADLRHQFFPQFFQDAPVAEQVARLLEGQPLNRRALQFMAKSAGFQPERYPDLNFDQALQEFEGAFLIRATHEPALQGIIEANQLLQQTQLLAESKGMLERLVALLQEVALKDFVGISTDSITATNVVSGTQIIYQLAPETELSTYPRHWESHYLRALITRCSGLDLTTMSASEATTDTLAIEAVFTTLYLEGAGRAEDEAVSDVLLPQGARRQEKEKVVEKRSAVHIEKKRRPITATEAVAHIRRLVILGQPGGGKSTLVNHIVTQLARQRRGDEDVNLPLWPTEYTPLPIRIVLRRFSEWLTREKRSGAAGDVWDYLAYLLDRWGCGDSYEGMRRTLINEGGLLFFDGLDEIRDVQARRAIIKGAVAEFAATETQCQVVVTSRPYAYGDPKWRLPEDQFVIVNLALFGQEQIKAFNEAWYVKIMAPRKDWREEQCRLRAARLTQTILARPHLRRLAASPLLLTLMAQVDSSGAEAMLPKNRAELYQRTVNLLLARWDNRLRLDDAPGEEIPEEEILWLDGLPTQELRDVLAKLAYDGHRAQGQQVAAAADDGSAVEISYQALRDALLLRFDSLKRVDEIILYIQHRTGLLVDKGAGVFTFPHRTYQEYLAGQHLQNTSSWQPRLIRHVKEAPDWWREVFLLSAASMTAADSVQYLVQALLPPERTVTPRHTTWVMIAAQALVETNFGYYVQLEKQQKAEEPDVATEDLGGFTTFYRRVQSWLQQAMQAEAVLPPKTRAEAGTWLAQLGDERDGVGVDLETRLPRLKWSREIPAGSYEIGDDKSEYDDEKPRQIVIEKPFRLARYPITNAQFQCFIDAPDWDEQAWWDGLPDKEMGFDEPAFPVANHPREMVSWYQAVAFCRWLNDKLQRGLLKDDELGEAAYELLLPHENEWEVAARWPNEDVQARIYPWGAEFDAAKANTSEGNIGQTSAVGIYPSGKNEKLDLYDMSGNVFEWCRNKFENPNDEAVDQSDDSRVLRGGSWYNSRNFARAASRYNHNPDHRYNYLGFRVVVVRRPPSHDH